MNLPAGWKKMPAVLLLVSTVATAVADEPTAGTVPSSSGGLKWTPHRPTRLADASTAGSMPANSAPASAIPAPAPTAPEAPVPAAESSPPPPRFASNPASMRPAPGYGPRPPATVRPDLPSAPFSLPPLKLPAMTSIFARSPQGEASRPMLASGEYQPPRIHGGHAPQLTDAPAFGGRPVARQSRVAMNVDELPSVMSKSPNPTAAPSAAQGPKAAAGPKSASPEFQAEQLPEMGGPIEFGPTGEVMTMDPHAPSNGMPSDGMWMGGYPDAMCHDPYADACGPEDECGFLPCCQPTGRVCAWLRQFGRPYYGWRWYRDFTASGGITGFQTPADMGIAGNFGTNEYANFGMPFWNAFGIGWQLGVRGVQTHFQQTSIEGLGNEPFASGARDQVFVTTGFFTRAFEGRGLQFGAVWDYLRDNWFDNVDLTQMRGEISYVWHAHEIGFWAAANYDTTPFTSRRISGNASTIDLYAAFYRLQFGDANEWKVWGGSTDNGDGLIGTLIRAPMTKSLALEGTFTYLIPKDTNTYPLGTDAEGDQISITTSDAAWNMSVNVVFYPACRSRRGLASPYRPLFEVADNGSMIRSLEGLYPTP